MPQCLDIAHLRTLVAIADCGGFGRAAAVLRISQPTVSKHVRALERAVGQPLVEKTGRQARFTSAGEALLAEARQILVVHDNAVRRLGAHHSPRLRFGATEHADQVLPEMLCTLRTAFPQHDMVFQLDHSPALVEATVRGSLDIALVPGDTPCLADEVGALPLSWCAAPAWSLPCRGEPLRLVAFQEPCSLRNQALRVLQGAGWPVRVLVDAVQLNGVIAAARAGIGVALLPTAGQTPRGLVEVTGLPAAGRVDLRVIIRQNLDPKVERAARDTLRSFFALWGQAEPESEPELPSELPEEPVA
ncbi:MAG TPA: LysR family transcriptional regulator [Pseudonocardiaceae bacterium]